MAEIIKFERKKKLHEDPPLTADEVLELSKGQYADVLIVGYTHSDIMGWASSAEITRETALYLVEHYKRILLSYDQ